MKDLKNVPSIRFSGFNEPWEQRKLAEIATMHARIGWQNLRTSEYLDSGKYMLITGTDFENGGIKFSSCHYVKKERYDQDNNIQITNGNILITKDGTLGKVAFVQGLTMPATLNAGVFNVELKKEINGDGKYLFQYLKAPYLMEYVSKNATGGTIKHLNQNILINFPVSFPTTKEQTKVGEFFYKIDNLITLHQRKLIKLKNLKKGLLEKMFPQDGENVPNLRFKNFTEPWEQRKLLTMANFNKGKGYSKKDLTQKGIPIILYGSLYTNYKTKIKDSELFSFPKKDAVYSVGNEVIVPASGETPEDIARASAVVKSGIILGGDLNIIYPNKDLSPTFLSISISNGRQKYILSQMAQGKSVVHLHNSDLKKIKIEYPRICEQNRIETAFEDLDNLITLHQRKLDKLENIKKSLLDKMFV